MKTPLCDEHRGVDFSWNYQLVNQAAAHAQYAYLPSQNQTESVCATIDRGKRLPAAQVKGLEDSSGLTTPASPVRDRTSTSGYEPEGKWVLHAFLECK